MPLYSRNTIALTKPFQHVKVFRLQLAKELIGDYCSRKRPGRAGGTIHSLPLHHLSSKIPVDEDTREVAALAAGTLGSRLGSAESAMCGYDTQESGSDCFLTWHTHLQQ